MKIQFNIGSLITIIASSLFFLIYFIKSKWSSWSITYFDNIVFSLGVSWFLLFLVYSFFGFNIGYGKTRFKIDHYPFFIRMVLTFVTSFLISFVCLGTVLYIAMIVFGLGLSIILYILNLIF